MTTKFVLGEELTLVGAVRVDPAEGRDEVLWDALMVCLDCRKRVIDCRCRDCLRWGCQGAMSDPFLEAIGRALKAQEAPVARDEAPVARDA